MMLHDSSSVRQNDLPLRSLATSELETRRHVLIFYAARVCCASKQSHCEPHGKARSTTRWGRCVVGDDSQVLPKHTLCLCRKQIDSLGDAHDGATLGRMTSLENKKQLTTVQSYSTTASCCCVTCGTLRASPAVSRSCGGRRSMLRKMFHGGLDSSTTSWWCFAFFHRLPALVGLPKIPCATAVWPHLRIFTILREPVHSLCDSSTTSSWLLVWLLELGIVEECCLLAAILTFRASCRFDGSYARMSSRGEVHSSTTSLCFLLWFVNPEHFRPVSTDEDDFTLGWAFLLDRGASIRRLRGMVDSSTTSLGLCLWIATQWSTRPCQFGIERVIAISDNPKPTASCCFVRSIDDTPRFCVDSSTTSECGCGCSDRKGRGHTHCLLPLGRPSLHQHVDATCGRGSSTTSLLPVWLVEPRFSGMWRD